MEDPENIDITTRSVQVPITSLTFVELPTVNGQPWGGTYLLSGGGSFVFVYEVKTGDLLAAVNVLGSRNIHGFAVQPYDGNQPMFGQICAFGERFLTTFHLIDDILAKSELQSKVPLSFHDRVMDVQWLRSQQNVVAVLLAHNEFLEVDVLSGNTVRSFSCEKNSVLFSGLIVDSFSTPFVVAGACLGYLYIWQPFRTSIDSNDDSLVELNLSSNAGGVFCMTVKDESLAVACEDRGIYIFKLDLDSRKHASLITLFGHSARIWKICWSDNYLVSAGEDCQILLWNVTDGSVIYRFESSSNTNFFALAVDPRQSHLIAAGLSDGSVRMYNAKVIMEGKVERPGDDTATAISNQSEHVVCLRFVDESTIIYVSSSGEISLIHLAHDCRTVLTKNAHYSMAVVLAVRREESRTLVALAHGVPSQITIFKLQKTTPHDEWNFLKISEFSSPSMDMPRAYLLSWIENHGKCSNTAIPMLFTSNFDVAANCVFDINGNKLLEFDLSKSVLPSDYAPVKHYDKIAINCAISIEDKSELFIFGDNCGSVIVAEKNSHSCEPAFLQAFPHVHGKFGCYSLAYSASESAVISCGGSSVCFFRVDIGISKSPLQLVNTIKPSSLDFAVFRFIFHNPEGINGSLSQERELVCGFAQKSFVITVVRPSQLIIARHYCSGRNREWDIIIPPENNIFKFAYVRQGRAFLLPVVLQSTDSSNFSREIELQSPLHGLRIHDCKFICRLAVSDSFVFAMVSEDATVSIVAIQDRQANPEDRGTTLHVLHRLTGHISGVRCVQVVPLAATEVTMGATEHNFLLFTGGSRGILIVWTLGLLDSKVDSLAKSVVCRKIAQIALTNDPIPSFDSAISDQLGAKTDIQKNSWRTRKIYGPPLSPDMRFMDIAVIQTNKRNFTSSAVNALVAVACSDATVRILQLNSGEGMTPKLSRLLCLAEEMSFCHLKIVFVALHPKMASDTDGVNGILISGDTGGHLNFWFLPEIIEASEEKHGIHPSTRIHQSGVNALEVHRCCDVVSEHVEECSSTASLIAFTGGDDTAIAISKIIVNRLNKQIQVTKLARINSAHGSQISGLCFVKAFSLICTVSIDQRLRCWKFCPTNSLDSATCHLVASCVSCVADASAVAVTCRTKNGIIPTDQESYPLLFALVVGEGCQFLKMKVVVGSKQQ